ncbi:MAG: Gfo/Idh/MocA family oxidoreductase [Verrucomicrobia bacterium]|nr:Gfo/Idh/MocA family oxidoreductase [Verrucomicrobiota bacterium]
MSSSPAPSPIGFGIVGPGLIADFHARAIAGIPGCAVKGVCGRSAGSTKAFADKHGVAFTTDRVEDLVARDDIQVVCVTTPSGAHLEPALTAIRAGRHVVIEKPIEVTLERMDALLAASRAAGVHLLPIFQARFGDGARTVKRALDAGRFGRLVLASAYVKWVRAAAYYHQSWHGTLALDGGGALINQAIHAVDLLQWFAGLPTDVFAFTTRRVHTGIEAEDTAAATLRFASGALGVIEATTAAHPGWSRRIEVCGENGSIVLEDDRITRWDFREAAPEDDAIRGGAAATQLGSGASSPGGISHLGHQRQIANLVEAIRTGAALEVDGPEARKAVALVLALYESARSGRPAHPSTGPGAA